MTDERTASAFDEKQLVTLAEQYCDGLLDTNGAESLEKVLRGNAAAQKVFLSFLDLHARLCWESGRGIPGAAEFSDSASVDTEIPTIPLTVPQRRSMSLVGYGIVLFAAMFVLVVAALWWSGVFPDRVGKTSNGVLATVTRAEGRWNGQPESIRAGEVYASTTLDLAQGFVELEYGAGITLIMEAPVELELVDARHAVLHEGRVVVKVSPRATDFEISTLQARLVNRSGEIGISVIPGGATEVQVFRGILDAEPKGQIDRKSLVDHVTAGQARKIEHGQSISIPSSTFPRDRFIRTFPKFDARQGPQLPFNHSRYETAHVRFAATPPTVDGDLADWRAISPLLSRCVDPYESYYVAGFLCYDANFLYVAAHVGDPAPMASAIDPDDDSSFFWAGGSVVLRLGADRSLAWPLDARADYIVPETAQYSFRPQDTNEHIVHVGMWYSHLQSAPQLCLSYGMDHHRRTDTAGWRAAFRKDADGLGYTMEYAIPWSLLQVSAAPKPGDVWPGSLTVHWSDHDGRSCLGQLVEITNFDRKPYHFNHGDTWGKVIFDAP